MDAPDLHAAHDPTFAPGGGGPGEAAEARGASAQLLEGLNDAQREAVEHAGGPLLILAGAGSGKTRVVTRRIAWLIAHHGVSPSEVIAITFTNKAAGEMRERVERLLPARGAWISTFHSMGARILRREIGALEGYTRDFTIYDTADRNQLVKELIKRAGYDATRFRPAAVGAWISERKNRRLGPDGLPEPPSESATSGIDDEVFARVWRDYHEALRLSNALDFDDLLLKVLEVFERHPGVRELYARRFRHVLVDEYQDTNKVQYLLMRHLAAHHGDLTVCGDPDQSIYAWRGADVRNILDFERDFAGARVVRLEQNYRSTGNILAAAQGLIAHNRMRKQKDLWSAAGAGERLVVCECADEDDEAREVVAQIRALTALGRRHDEIAVFYRVNFMQRALERALRLSGTPYQIVAGTEFYQRREIKDLVAYLRLIVNPSDDEACRRVVNVPPRGIGERSLAGLASWALDRRLPLSAACGSTEARAPVRGRARNALAAFAELHARLAALREMPALVALDQVLDETGYLGWLARSPDAAELDREANVEELRSHAEAYDRATPDGGLRGFLQDIALVSEVDAYAPEQPKVTLMTLHAAKGLEFPVVFVCGLEEELLPHARAIQGDYGEGADGDEPGVEEERRLLYVGMTRARERLFLTHAQVRRHFGSEQFCRPSRFLDELPPELIEGGGAAGVSEGLGAYEPEDEAWAPREGDWVLHEHFGRGRVETLAGRGVNARATVRFDRHGSRQLLLQYAKLRPSGGGR